MNMRRLDLRWTSLLGLLACSTACGGSDGSGAPPIDTLATDGSLTTATTGGTGTMTGGSSSADSTTGEDVTNCDNLVCAGHGKCDIGEDGKAFCACDPGYKVDASGDACEVDESCVQLRFLEDHCRQLYNAYPAVSLFFALEFCAGTAVLPAKVEELGLQFQILENGVDINANVESYATVVPKPVESYVDIVLDVSDSITGSQGLPALITELRALVTSLEPGADGPDVYAAVHVFGRDSAEYVPFTRDLNAVDAALALIAEDPTDVVQLAGNGNGTDLYDAVALGIHRTQRIRDLRDAVTWGGVLSTGTVVVVTDGNDTSNGTLDTGLIKDTTNNIVSIGISGDVVNDTLQQIGRDGSFLAPSSADWPAAFAEISQRVHEYPGRSYLLAYCSSATEGDPEVEISVMGAETVASTAVCKFNADSFSTDPMYACGAELFANECVAFECGGLTACGACADDACCDGQLCRAPAQTPADCRGQNDLCAAGQICNETGDCVAPEPIGSGQCGEGCAPGVSHCFDDMATMVEECVPVAAPGAACNAPSQCPELNCQRDNPDNLFQPTTCQPEALLYDRCGSDDAICEVGGYCSSVCLPRKFEAESCSKSSECRLATCTAFPDAGSRCAGAATCFWSWDEKVPA